MKIDKDKNIIIVIGKEFNEIEVHQFFSNVLYEQLYKEIQGYKCKKVPYKKELILQILDSKIYPGETK